jgi:hypothetical protein
MLLLWSWLPYFDEGVMALVLKNASLSQLDHMSAITVIQYIVGEISCNYIPDIHCCLNCILIPHCSFHPRLLIFSMRLETYGTCFPVMVPLFSSPR